MSIPWYLFPHPIALKVSGRDARRYLHNRLSHDIKSLEVGGAIRAAALTAQGRVEGLFSVFADSNETFYLVCDAGVREEIRIALGRYIVADRVEIEDISDTSLFFHTCADSKDLRATLSMDAPAKLYDCAHARLGSVGVDGLITPDFPGSRDMLRARLGEPLTEEFYERLRIMHGEPAFPSEVNGEVILTEAGLFEAVSFTKGCYVGQEVIERSDAIGKLPRSLERIRLGGHAEIAPDTEVLSASGERLGKVLTCTPGRAGEPTFVFALLRTGKYGIGDPVTCAGVRGEILARPDKKRG